MKIISYFFLFYFYFSLSSASTKQSEFNDWVDSFIPFAISQGISKATVIEVMKNAKYLPKVIEYDRYQPEFYEDTNTYIKKRTSLNKIKEGSKIYKNNKNLIDNIEKLYNINKSLLLALMGIETNFGKYLGKMDIISSLATLSFDLRRRDFFTNELITILKLIDDDLIDHKILYGSWAGAFGNFQFMPTTIRDYAVDYDKNQNVELKATKDSFASAANYLNLIGWKKNKPCFMPVKLNKNIPTKFLNSSAKKIHNQHKLSYFSKYIENYDDIILYKKLNSAIITPDIDIIKDANRFEPAYIIFDNYKVILKWNRSLRFALAVCTLMESFENAL